MDVYVARQPIFQRDNEIFGYELLFREGTDNFYPNIDGDRATSKLLENIFFTIGIGNITGSKIAFINFTRDLLVKRIPILLPRQQVVVEILEDVEPEEAVLKSCEEIRQKGYPIALDDFFYGPRKTQLLSLANIIKFDFRSASREQIKRDVKRLAPFDLKLLAEKVETYEDFQWACQMGFTYFQGYFLGKPEVFQLKEIPMPDRYMDTPYRAARSVEAQ